MKRCMVLPTLALGLSLGLLAGCGKKPVQPEELLTEYMDLLNQKDYADMYDLLTEEAQETTDEETYVNRYKNIYGGIEASHIRIELTGIEDKKEKNAETRRVPYTLTMDTLAGELSFDTTAIFTKNEDGDYKMSWDSQDIFPNLYNEDTVRVVTTYAKRGNIYDRNQVELAREGVASSVGLVPGKLPADRSEAVTRLSELLEMNSEKIEKALDAGWVRDDTFVPIRTVARDEMELKEQLLTIPGVMITDTKVRFYPFGEKAAQLTGYVQNINAEELEKRAGLGYNRNSTIGKAGAERIYEEQLRARDGYTIQIVNQQGQVKDTVLEKPAQDGQDVKLTIDITLQQYLYQEMEDDRGCAVALDPTTGAVRALVSTPAYDPNDFVLGYTASAWEALNADEARPLYNRFLAAWNPGPLLEPVKAALAESKSGRTLSDLGFGEALPFDFEATVSEEGKDGALVNPVHLSCIYSALANGGNLVKPCLQDGTPVTYWKEGVFTKEAAEAALAGLYQEVEEPFGFAHEASRKAFRMAGAAGRTALTDAQNETGARTLDWFVGISAEQTEDPLLITMMLENVSAQDGSHYVIPKAMKGFDEYKK